MCFIVALVSPKYYLPQENEYQKAVFENTKNESDYSADTCQGSIQWDNTSIFASEYQILKRSVPEPLENQHQGTELLQNQN